MQKPFDDGLLSSMKILSPEELAAFKKEWEMTLKNNPNWKTIANIQPTVQYNKPAHYHKHEIDTIAFLQGGFPPEVFMGFAIGHVIKYAQRAEYKNGREDYVKMFDYAKRALDWYDKTHS